MVMRDEKAGECRIAVRTARYLALEGAPSVGPKHLNMSAGEASDKNEIVQTYWVYAGDVRRKNSRQKVRQDLNCY